MPKTTESTSFTRDVQGRYLCNDIDEVNQWKTSGDRPFDFIVVGGGTFGAAIAEHLWYRQKRSGGGLRTLVIEAGLFTVPEHVQNAGIQGLNDPPTGFFLNENAPQPEPPRNEVWGIPWKSSTPFKGLAYAIGGRSVYWGGWSPRLLPAEVATWPPNLVAALDTLYFDESSRQIGVDETNDFIFGELHRTLRRQLFDNLAAAPAAIPLNQLPPSPLLKPGANVDELLGPGSTTGLSPNDLQNLLKLEAPLAVQARAPHAGFFPMNKFSTVPLLMKAARTASNEGKTDAQKEFMVLPGTHILSVRVAQTGGGTWRATGVDTSRGFIELAAGGAVVIALGTIESARLALLTFDGKPMPTLPLMGRNLMGHLRSNLVIRVPRTAIAGLSPSTNELQASALFVKCRATAQDGSVIGHFHLQISATGGGNAVGAEDELFRKVPDIDFFDQLRTSNDTHVAIAIRGIGEMSPADLNNLGAHPSRVELDAGTDEYGVRRARVTLSATARDNDLWTIMDATMLQVAQIFANGQPFTTIQSNQDGLGTTHHETGTLWMGTDPAKSVTDDAGRFHHTENLYASGPCLFPSIGSPNPMLTGIAVARRTGDRIVTPEAAFTPDAGFQALFDGSAIGSWRMSTIQNQPGRDNPGRFLVRRGALEAHPGTDLGMLWLDQPTPARFILRLQWMMTGPEDNSGVFVAFPHPEQQGYKNTSYVGVDFGFEIQIDELARPDGAAIHGTGAIYSFKGATDGPVNVRPVGEWNSYEIKVDRSDFTVSLNGNVINNFHFAGDPQSPRRGLASTAAEPRFIGLQTHTGTVLFRHIQWKPF